MLTFIIPVRHHANAKDWPQLVDYLGRTIAAIERQTSREWRAVIVANEGSVLPAFSSRIEICRVGLPPNPFHELGSTDLESFREAVRLDKGSRILAGMRAAGETDYFMVVDDDDYISNRIAAFVERAGGQAGWYFRDGYVWSTGGRLLYRHEPFHLYCGTSHIIRADLIDLNVGDDAVGQAYVKKILGSHVFIADALATQGKPLLPMPFTGAVYRIGHASAHSKSPSVIRKFLLDGASFRHPLRFVRAARRFRLRDRAIDGEFFGSDER